MFGSSNRNNSNSSSSNNNTNSNSINDSYQMIGSSSNHPSPPSIKSSLLAKLKLFGGKTKEITLLLDEATAESLKRVDWAKAKQAVSLASSTNSGPETVISLLLDKLTKGPSMFHLIMIKIDRNPLSPLPSKLLPLFTLHSSLCCECI
ncbi:hypothetical protein BASA83_009445 [Batrachochytrium salamandrivorans]|nr:hypothetical protein BASA83_009445 [Batrachochytrium salamandrivorans]